MGRKPMRRGGGAEDAWGSWTAPISTPDGTRRTGRRSRWRWILGATVLVGMTSAAIAVLRGSRHRRTEESSSRIEFVDVDRPMVRR
jgi:hypothetical protein